MPNLPDELRQKQEQIDTAAGRNAKLSPTPPPDQPGERKPTFVANNRYKKRIGSGNNKAADGVLKERMTDPLQIIALIREQKDVGFLYMTAAVPHSSIKYNPYNLKYVILFLFYV